VAVEPAENGVEAEDRLDHVRAEAGLFGDSRDVA